MFFLIKCMQICFFSQRLMNFSRFFVRVKK